MPAKMIAHKIVLSDAPPGGILCSVRLQVDIEPPSGAVLLYGSPNYADPVRVAGPLGVADLPTTEPAIYVRLVSGAVSFSLGVLSYVEDTGRRTQFEGAPLTIHKGSGRGEEITIG